MSKGTCRSESSASDLSTIDRDTEVAAESRQAPAWWRGEYIFQPGVNRFDTEKEQRHMSMDPEEFNEIMDWPWH